jgi:hypothetical protein
LDEVNGDADCQWRSESAPPERPSARRKRGEREARGRRVVPNALLLSPSCAAVSHSGAGSDGSVLSSSPLLSHESGAARKKTFRAERTKA